MTRDGDRTNKCCTILVVDDDPDLRETLVDILKDVGFDVVSAEHGAAALQVVQQRDVRPSAILLDIMMPVMDGPTFAVERMKEPRLATVPVIALTAHRDCAWAGNAVGALVCLSKPLKLETLLSTIDSAVGRGEGQPASAAH